ncbi:MerR family transcriptional regulator [Xinfangfangia sp. CPCC 101601]|uniref:MerR family transcriptional regulator n=1 Tax=Pseudogemmobacter lacusdianii TaxID=3069608 RepID=A0ABU0VUV0_9RHOB|nr:MerR family transcriptional regulator [Xinfangfangia sp. CPCC 101601]MDQ2065510.1 MerR family transcriptional regulator [Xinfangfangia sp. CPCC 101601]
MDKSPEAFRTISEVAEALETPAHVLRFWESRFPQIKPVKRAGGRRYYRPADIALLSGIKRLLHDDGMTIRGVQKILREQGVRHVSGIAIEAEADAQALEQALSGRYSAQAPSGLGFEAAPLEERGVVLPFLPTEPASSVAAEADLPETEAPGEILVEAPEMTTQDPTEQSLTVQERTRPDTAPAGDEAEAVSDLLSAGLPDHPAKASEPDDAESAAEDPVMAAPESAPFAADLFAAAPVAAPPVPELPAAEAPEQAKAPQPSVVSESTIELGPDEDTATLAARLRALPRGAFQDRQEALLALAHRIAALRASMGAPTSHN